MDYTVKITGEAGQGLQSIGQLLGKYFVRQGFYVFANQDNESRIRGGHNFYQLRISNEPVFAISENVSMLVPLDLKGVELNLKEVDAKGTVVLDSSLMDHHGDDPRFISYPFNTLALETGGNKLFSNSAATAVILALLNQPLDPLEKLLEETFGKYADKNVAVAQSAYNLVGSQRQRIKFFSAPKSDVPHMFLNGHDAIALGAIAAGCKFMAAYPMSPSTGIITYMAEKADRIGMVIEQAEDEIAAMNMAIGASNMGVRAITATSGGGFSLMVEALGLAGMTETPVVAVNAQRPGPATGLPTRTEQGDLQFVINAAQGEFPRFVFAPESVADCFYLTVRAFNLADQFQVPVIILTDQHLAESYGTVEKFDLNRVSVDRYIETSNSPGGIYHRYQLAEDGISPRRLPGFQAAPVALDSDEHDEFGYIIEDAKTRQEMMDKRMAKMSGMSGQLLPPRIIGDQDAHWVFLCWGSTGPAMVEAGAILRGFGEKVQVRCLTEVWPWSKKVLADLPKGARLIVVEGNYSGQLAHILASETGLIAHYRINRYDGRPFSPEYIVSRFAEITGERGTVR